MYVFLRMIHRGVFDEFPGLKIILGHFGEAIPFLLDRVDTVYRQGYCEPNADIGPGSKELASRYVKKNLWVTSSGNYLPAAYYSPGPLSASTRLGLDRRGEDSSEGCQLLTGGPPGPGGRCFTSADRPQARP